MVKNLGSVRHKPGNQPQEMRQYSTVRPRLEAVATAGRGTAARFSSQKRLKLGIVCRLRIGAQWARRIGRVV
jgi:hypothetical protein